VTTQFPNAISDQTTTVAPTATRITPQPAQPFAHVLRAGAGAVIDGAEAAAQRIPGGPLLSAAFRPGAAVSDGSAGPNSTVSSAGPIDGVAPGSDEGTLQSALQAQAENSLYYLQLQQQIQEENRAYSTLSNVLKARHETVKNAIGNIR
jgi:hypothetical protein